MHAAAASLLDKRPRCCFFSGGWCWTADPPPPPLPTHTHTLLKRTHTRTRGYFFFFFFSFYSSHLERLDTTSVCFYPSSWFFFLLLDGISSRTRGEPRDRPAKHTHTHTHTPARTREATGQREEGRNLREIAGKRGDEEEEEESGSRASDLPTWPRDGCCRRKEEEGGGGGEGDG